MSSVVESFPDKRNWDPKFKLPVLTRQHMIDWINEAYNPIFNCLRQYFLPTPTKFAGRGSDGIVW